MQYKKFAALVLAVVCLGLGPAIQPRKSYRVLDDSGFTVPVVNNNVGEIQSTVIPPGTKGCEEGRILVTNDWVRGANGTVNWMRVAPLFDTSNDSTFDAPDANTMLSTNDHDLVYVGDREVWYVTGAFTKRPFFVKGPNWGPQTFRNDFGSGARSNVVVWRSTDCGQSFHRDDTLEFDPAVMGDGTCALPQPPRVYRHKETPDTNLLVPFEAFDTAAQTDSQWGYCGKCKQLVSVRAGQASVCVFGGNHDANGGYKLLAEPIGAPEQTGWQRCRNCGALFHGNGTKCPAQMGHDDSQSIDFQLVTSTEPDPGLEPDWHWCSKCQGLFHGPNAGTSCPRGGTHDAGGNYQAALQSFSAAPGALGGWRMCSKCRGMFFNTGVGVCPKGGAHDPTNSKSYRQLEKTPQGFSTQAGWKLCKHCKALFFSKNDQPTRCPFIRPHDGTGSPAYRMLRGNADATNLQAGWRRCSKCGALYFAPNIRSGCPYGDPGDIPVYDAGGSDGQLARSDPANHRVYLTFQCVGYKPDAGVATPFELSGTHVNKTLIAVSTNGQPWKLAGVIDRAVWRMGIQPLDANHVAFGFSDVIVRGTFDGAGNLKLGAPEPAAAGLGWEIDWRNDPYKVVKTNVPAHTVVTRIPGVAGGVLLVSPDTMPNGTGYRLFFYDPKSTQAQEAVDRPILPVVSDPEHVAFHLQVVDPGSGPVLLTWNDFNIATMRIGVRGRLITGMLKMTDDFTISRTDGVSRHFDAETSPITWFGDYQTSSGYAVSANQWVYKPVWVEPPQQVRFGHVEYVASSSARDVFRVKGKLLPMRKIDLQKLKIENQPEKPRSQ